MNKPPERSFNPAIYPVANKRNNEDVNTELCSKRCYTFYSNDKKLEFFIPFIFNKSPSASAAGRQLGIHIRAAKGWVKRDYKDPESMLEKKKALG